MSFREDFNFLIRNYHAVVAQLVEHIHGKDEVCGSIPHNGSFIAESKV